MQRLYPTIHNNRDDFGLPAYEVRGTDIYPTIHNKYDEFGPPTYQLRD